MLLGVLHLVLSISLLSSDNTADTSPRERGRGWGWGRERGREGEGREGGRGEGERERKGREGERREGEGDTYQISMLYPNDLTIIASPYNVYMYNTCILLHV